VVKLSSSASSSDWLPTSEATLPKQEQVGDERRLPAQACHLQLVAHLLGLEHTPEVEPFDDILHEALGRDAQAALALFLGKIGKA